jgi:hypothetical protein
MSFQQAFTVPIFQGLVLVHYHKALLQGRGGVSLLPCPESPICLIAKKVHQAHGQHQQHTLFTEYITQLVISSWILQDTLMFFHLVAKAKKYHASPLNRGHLRAAAAEGATADCPPLDNHLEAV